MKYEPEMKPDFMDLGFEIKTQGSISERIERTEDHKRLLNPQFLNNDKGRILTPSAINTWLNCRMKFYYRYVNRLKEAEKVTKDVDPAMLGNILHEIMKILYQDYSGEVLSKEILDSFISDNQFLAKVTSEAISAKFNNEKGNLPGGNELIVRDVLMAYLEKILRTDKALAPFTVLHLEESFRFVITILSGGFPTKILTGGKVDRVDLVNGITRIVDYKTGNVADIVNSIGVLFDDDRKKDADGWLQTLLYCEAYLANNPESIVRPSVYKIRKLTGSTITDKLRLKTDNKNEMMVENYQIIREEFMYGLKNLVTTIFSDGEPFIMTSDIRGKCSFCPYKTLCMR